jgi:hypothetical protein
MPQRLPTELVALIAGFAIEIRVALGIRRPLRLTPEHRRCIQTALTYRCWVPGPFAFDKLIVPPQDDKRAFVVNMVPAKITDHEWRRYTNICILEGVWPRPLSRCWWSGRTCALIGFYDYTDAYTIRASLDSYMDWIGGRTAPSRCTLM